MKSSGRSICYWQITRSFIVAFLTINPSQMFSPHKNGKRMVWSFHCLVSCSLKQKRLYQSNFLQLSRHSIDLFRHCWNLIHCSLNKHLFKHNFGAMPAWYWHTLQKPSGWDIIIYQDQKLSVKIGDGTSNGIFSQRNMAGKATKLYFEICLKCLKSFGVVPRFLSPG